MPDNRGGKRNGGPLAMQDGQEIDGATGRSAVLVLARSPRIEARLKALDRGRPGSGSRFFRASLRRTLDAARSVRGPDLHVAIAPEDRRTVRRVMRATAARSFLQEGASFADRVENAVGRLRAEGYARILVLAGDCPGITERHIDAALCALAENPVVLGPSGDGGLYLLGFQFGALDRLDLRSVPWLTGEVHRTLEARAAQASLPVSTLDRLDDVDGRRSAQHLVPDLVRRASREAARLLALLRESLFERPPLRPAPESAPIRHTRNVAGFWCRPPPRA